MKRQHGIANIPTQGGAPSHIRHPVHKGPSRGRGPRMMVDNQPQVHHQQQPGIVDSGDGWSGGASSASEGPSSEPSVPAQLSGKETPRPVGQVAPAQRSLTPKSEHDQV